MPALLLQECQVIIQANGGAGKLASDFEHHDLVLSVFRLYFQNILCIIVSSLL